MTIRRAMLVAFIMLQPVTAAGQDRGWIAEFTIGYAGFVDDATKNYFLAAGGVRRLITPRLSIGGELVTMSNPDLLRDRNLMLTGNVVFDVHAANRARRLTPFIVGGLGMFWGRDRVRGGPYWSSDPAFTAGAGVRARLGESVSAAAEYRLVGSCING